MSIENSDQKRDVQQESGENVEKPEAVPESDGTAPERTQAEISTELTGVEEKLGEERTMLNEARAAVGLPPSDKSAAIGDLSEKQDRLKNELGASPEKGADEWAQKTPETKNNAGTLEPETVMRNALSPVSENLQRLLGTLRQR